MYLSRKTGRKFCLSPVAIVSTVNEKTLFVVCCCNHVEVSRLDVIAALCLVEVICSLGHFFFTT